MEDKPIKCEFHCWIPFLSHKYDFDFSPLYYYRICEVCGCVELRDKIKEWREMYGLNKIEGKHTDRVA